MENSEYNFAIKIIPDKNAVFSHLLGSLFNDDVKRKLTREHLNVLDKVSKLGDDRLVAMTGELLVENAVDSVLQAFMPTFKETFKRPSFYTKIEFARALTLCPSHLFDSAHSIREIRNDFAHNLEVANFSMVSPKRIEKLRAQYRLYDWYTPPRIDSMNTAQVFIGLTYEISIVLHAYALQTAILRRYLHDEGFQKLLENFCASQHAAASPV